MPRLSGMQVHELQIVRGLAPAGLLLGLLLASPAAAQTSSVEWARQLYNQGRYDQAIIAAARLLTVPAQADAAGLIVARAHLERFRRGGDQAELVAGRDALRGIHPAALVPRDQIEFVVGLGETLFLEESFGPAAEMFDTVLERTLEKDPRSGDRVFDWWASALDRQAQAGEGTVRDAVYLRIAERAQAVMAHYPAAGAAPYWLVVAYRALGQTTRAWDAAVSAWMRAGLAGEGSVALRADLDKLVVTGLIPDRARQEESNDRDRERAATTLRSSWDAIKREWGPK